MFAQTVISLAIFAHGVGHLLFFANSWGYWKDDSGRSPVFSDVLHVRQSTEGMIGLLWMIPVIGFSLVASSYYSQTGQWEVLAVATAATSSLLLALWWKSLNNPSAFFAFAFNLILIVQTVISR
jgi:hypothetical protein